MIKLLETFSEEDYTIEELCNLFIQYSKKRSENIGASLVTQKPILDGHGNVIGISTDCPAVLCVYKRYPD